MIRLREGVPGSGKSLTAVVEDLLPALKDGRRVVTNLPLIVSAVEKRLGMVLDGQLIVLEDDGIRPPPFSVIEHWTEYEAIQKGEKQGPLYIVDECHEVMADEVSWRYARFPEKEDVDHQREHKQFLSDLKEWVATHRHKRIDVTFITQTHMDIWSKVRRRIEIRLEYIPQQLRATWHKRKAYEGMATTPLGTNNGPMPKEGYGLYRTARGKQELAKRKIINPLKSPMLMFMVFLAIVPAGFVMANGGFTRVFDMVGNAPGAETDQSDQAVGSEDQVEEGQGFAQPFQTFAAGTIVPSRPETEETPEAQTQNVAHPYQNASLWISGTLTFDGVTSYYLTAQRGSKRSRDTVAQFMALGYQFVGIGPCAAYVEAPNGDYWNISCQPTRLSK